MDNMIETPSDGHPHAPPRAHHARVAADHDPAHAPPSLSCPARGEPMTRWAGFAGIEHTADGRLVERVAGPCPRCGGPLEAHETGMWD